VATRALDAGTVLAATDVTEVQAARSDALSALAHDLDGVVGRRLAVAVPSGAPLGAMLLVPSGVSAGVAHRLVRMPVDAAALTPDLVLGATLDVLAAVPDGPDGGRVLSVAAGRLVAVTGGSSPAVTLDVEASAASRLLWAQTFAKSLRLLVRPGGDSAPPPDVSGLGR
jgi:hypothetical protein